MKYYCSLCSKPFETRTGLRYIYASTIDDEDGVQILRSWDWVVCEGTCADKVREESTKIVEDRSF